MFFYFDSAHPPCPCFMIINSACCLLGGCCHVPSYWVCCSPVLPDNLPVHMWDIISVSLSSCASLSPLSSFSFFFSPQSCAIHAKHSGIGRSRPFCTLLVMQLNLMGKAHNLPLLRLNLTNVIMWHRHRSICKHTKAGMMTEFQDVSRSWEGGGGKGGRCF